MQFPLIVSLPISRNKPNFDTSHYKMDVSRNLKRVSIWNLSIYNLIRICIAVETDFRYRLAVSFVPKFRFACKIKKRRKLNKSWAEQISTNDIHAEDTYNIHTYRVCDGNDMRQSQTLYQKSKHKNLIQNWNPI